MMDTDKNITEETEKKDTLILAIESSCDETAASVVKNGREVLSNVISSQIALHTQFGGVVPEIASRKHIEKINQVVTQVWLRQKPLLLRRKSRWWAYIILRAMCLRTFLKIRIWSRPLCA